MGYALLKIVKKHTGEYTKTFSWSPGAVAGILRMFAPSEFGGRLDGLKERAEALALETGRPIEECYDEVNLRCSIAAV